MSKRKRNPLKSFGVEILQSRQLLTGGFGDVMIGPDPDVGVVPGPGEPADAAPPAPVGENQVLGGPVVNDAPGVEPQANPLEQISLNLPPDLQHKPVDEPQTQSNIENAIPNQQQAAGTDAPADDNGPIPERLIDEVYRIATGKHNTIYEFNLSDENTAANIEANKNNTLANADTVRADAETVRADADTVRANADTVRADADTVRADAETTRVEGDRHGPGNTATNTDDAPTQFDDASTQFDNAATHVDDSSPRLNGGGQTPHQVESRFKVVDGQEVPNIKWEENPEFVKKHAEMMEAGARRDYTELARLESELEDLKIIEDPQKGLIYEKTGEPYVAPKATDDIAKIAAKNGDELAKTGSKGLKNGLKSGLKTTADALGIVADFTVDPFLGAVYYDDNLEQGESMFGKGYVSEVYANFHCVPGGVGGLADGGACIYVAVTTDWDEVSGWDFSEAIRTEFGLNPLVNSWLGIGETQNPSRGTKYDLSRPYQESHQAQKDYGAIDFFFEHSLGDEAREFWGENDNPDWKAFANSMDAARDDAIRSYRDARDEWLDLISGRPTEELYEKPSPTVPLSHNPDLLLGPDHRSHHPISRDYSLLEVDESAWRATKIDIAERRVEEAEEQLRDLGVDPAAVKSTSREVSDQEHIV